VALARSLASEPRLLLLDEPFASQDQELKMQLVELVREIRRSKSVTTIYVTHTTEEISRLADRVAALEHGTIQQVMNASGFNPARKNYGNP
jgi:ABC-type sulfate/molybdate transport systems ATPase subunit